MEDFILCATFCLFFSIFGAVNFWTVEQNSVVVSGAYHVEGGGLCLMTIFLDELS
jgi:hypothetical protein